MKVLAVRTVSVAKAKFHLSDNLTRAELATQGRQRGFTLVELVMVIVLMGVIGGMVAVFMRKPIEAYIDGGRRAALTDVADTVVRRMARDIQRALPNSIGTSDDKQCLEFIPTKTGGRYRENDIISGDSTALNIPHDVSASVTDDRFKMLGVNSSLSDQRIVAGDLIAVSNMGMQDDLNAYFGTNTAVISTVTDVEATTTPPLNGPQTKIVFASREFQSHHRSPGKHFQVIPKDEQVVAYVCSGSNLYRIARKTLEAATPSNPGNICPATGSATIETTDPIIARHVKCGGTATKFDYGGPDLQRNALVSMTISVTDSDETVSLYHEVHVSNEP